MKLLFDGVVAHSLRVDKFDIIVNPTIIHLPKLFLKKYVDIYSYHLDIKDDTIIRTNGSVGKQIQRDFVISPYYTAHSPNNKLSWIIIPTTELLQYYAVLKRNCAQI